MSKKKKTDVALEPQGNTVDLEPLQTLAPTRISYGEWLTLRKHDMIPTAFEGKDKSFVPSLVKKGLLDDKGKITDAGVTALTGYFS